MKHLWVVWIIMLDSTHHNHQNQVQLENQCQAFLEAYDGLTP